MWYNVKVQISGPSEILLDLQVDAVVAADIGGAAQITGLIKNHTGRYPDRIGPIIFGDKAFVGI
jgi:hypothetical protein